MSDAQTTALPPGTTLAALPRTGDIEQWTDAEKGLADFIGMTAKTRNQDGTYSTIVAPRGVREAYLIQVERTQLDPIARQIYLAYIGGKWLILTAIDGFRLISQRSKKYRGQTPPQWFTGNKIPAPMVHSGQIVFNQITGEPVMTETEEWVNVWADPSKNPVAARVGIHMEGYAEPVYAIATWEGYGKTGKSAGQWEHNGPNMLAKCAEALARRIASPQELSGIYTSDEMSQGTQEAVEGTGRDWGEELEATNLLGLTVLYDEFRSSGEWSAKLDSKFRARRSKLAREAEEAKASKTITVSEGVTE
jgi:hypothetical protein